MPDPRNTINPETGRPIGEDRISSFDRRLSAVEIDADETDESGGPEPSFKPPVARPKTGTVVFADTNDPDWIEKVTEALFD